MIRFSLPDTWQKKLLSEVAQVQTGVALGRSDISDPVRLPYLRVANVQDGYFDLREIKTIEIQRHEIGRYSLQQGDVLFTEGGDFDKLGRGAVWQGEIPNCVHQNHIFAVRVDPTKVLPYYLAAYSSGFYGRTYFLGCSKQTTNLASINSTQLKEMPLPLPPLPEQKKIAAILSTWDRAIELTEKMIAAKQKRKQALMQRLLTGKVRFAEFGKPASHGLPVGWTRVPLSLLGNWKGGGTPLMSNPEYWTDGTIPWVSSQDIKGHEVNATRWITPKAVEESSANVVPSGSLLMVVRSGILRHTFPVVMVHYSVAINQDIRALTVNDRHCGRFVFNALDYRQRDILRQCAKAGTTVESIDYDKLKSYELPIPPLPEQKRIALLFDDAIREILLLEQRVSAWKEQKKGLMQQLLTGKIRVNITDASGG